MMCDQMAVVPLQPVEVGERNGPCSDMIGYIRCWILTLDYAVDPRFPDRALEVRAS